jgi:predicted TIM-barrel fold metal-dependent hydrolase
MKRNIMALLALACTVTTVHAQRDLDSLLLKDYRPKSIYKIPVTENRKQQIPVIDMHSHAYASSQEELAQWAATMKKLGIQKTIVLTSATGATFDSLYAAYSPFAEQFELWCGFDFSTFGTDAWPKAALDELERCHRVGAKGIGELSDKGLGELYSRPLSGPGAHLHDPAVKPLLEKCAELKMPVSIHIAEPQWMYEPMDSTNDGLMNGYKWRIDKEAPGLLGYYELLDAFETAVKDNPKTTFIACHLANREADLSALGKLLDKYPNLYADISARYGETSPIPRYMKKFYNQYKKRLVYGTDMGMEEAMYLTTFRILETADEHWYEVERFNYHWPMHGFDLSKKTLKRIYNKNAKRILTP